MKLKHFGMLGTALALGVGAAGQVQAGAMAQALLEVTGFQFQNTAGTRLVIGTDVLIPSFTDQLNNNANLNGVFDFNGAATGVFVPVINALQACVGACAIAENTFVAAAVPPATLYSRSDSLLTGAPVLTGIPAVDALGGANARTIGETSLPGNSLGGSGSQIQLTASLTVILPAGLAAGSRIDFDANKILRAWTSLDTVPGSSAGASMSWSITLSQGGTQLINWVPDGTVGTGTFVGLTELADACLLTDTASATNAEPNAAIACSGDFTAITNVAIAPGAYSLTIGHNVQTQAQVVPEPATLALLGAVLLGIGFARRRTAA